MTPLRIRQALLSAAAVLSAILLTACGAPDLTPLSDATKAMSDQMKSGFAQTQAAMALAAGGGTYTLPSACISAAEKKTFECLSKQLDDTWMPTAQAIDAVVAFSDSLTKLAASVKSNEAAVNGLIDSVSGLASSFPAAAQYAKAAEEVYAFLADMKASRDIHKAEADANKAVNSIARVLGANLNDLAVIFNSAADVWQSKVQSETKNIRDYHKLLADEAAAVRSQLLLIGAYERPKENTPAAAMTQVKNENLQALAKVDPAFNGMTAGQAADTAVANKRLALTKALDALNGELRGVRPDYNQAVADWNITVATRQAGDAALKKAKAAIVTWQKANDNLLKDGGPAAGKQGAQP